jgi:CRISPR/Cas system-associated exonuclease Cas4 (RecB family)
MSKDGRIWLSHTGLEILERCPRCFWLYYKKGIRQPEGIVSRLANRFDIVLKNYFNAFRQTGELPPMVAGKLEGRLQNPFQEKYFIRINDSYGFFGKLDECLINNKAEYIPIDFKTSSSDPREKETLSAYQSQIDSYICIMQENGLKVAGFGYLVYVYPDQSQELHNGFPMIIHVAKLSGNPQNTIQKIEKAVKILEEKMPLSHPACPFCSWYETMKAELEEKNKDRKMAKMKKGTIHNLELDFG